jgi:acyl carrier protein
MEKVKNLIKEIITDQLDLDEGAAISETANLIDDLGADSLDEVEILIAIEEEFDVEIDDLEAEKLKTVGDWFEYAEKNNFKLK